MFRNQTFDEHEITEKLTIKVDIVATYAKSATVTFSPAIHSLPLGK